MAITEWINYLDLISYKPEFKIDGNSRFITKFGKSVNLICIFTILIMSIIIMMDVLTRKTYTNIYNLDNREFTHVNISQSQIALVLMDALGNDIIEPHRYFNFLVKYWKVETPKNYTQNTTDYRQSYSAKSTIIDLPVKNCSYMNYTKFEGFYDVLSKTFSTGRCIDLSGLNETLFGIYGGVDGYSSLNIYIRKCVNSSATNKTDCYPEEVIDKKLSQVFINLISIENDIDSNNFENPISEFYKNEMLPLSSTIFKIYYKDINVVKFNSNNGLIFDAMEKFTSHRTDKIMESVDLRGKNTLFPGTFSQITIRCSGKTEIYYRNYLKIQASFAYIGSILQAVLLIGQCFVYMYSQNSMLNYLIMKLFDYEEIKAILNNEKNKNSNVCISQVSKIKPTQTNLQFMNNEKHRRLFLKGVQFRVINNNSNSHLVGNETNNINFNLYNYINNENTTNIKRETKFINENKDLKLSSEINSNNENFVNLKLLNENNDSEAYFYNKLKDKPSLIPKDKFSGMSLCINEEKKNDLKTINNIDNKTILNNEAYDSAKNDCPSPIESNKNIVISRVNKLNEMKKLELKW